MQQNVKIESIQQQKKIEEFEVTFGCDIFYFTLESFHCYEVCTVMSRSTKNRSVT